MQQFFACYETLYIQTAMKALYVAGLHLHRVIISSLHWPIPGFLYAFFVQWSILPTSTSFLPYPSPTHIFSAQSIILHAQTQSYFVNICKLLSVLSFAGKKTDSFHTVNKKWLNFFYSA